eukprot:8106710-Pyramimonas_sp.AAC.1
MCTLRLLAAPPPQTARLQCTGLDSALAAFQRSMSWSRQLRISATIMAVTCEVAVCRPLGQCVLSHRCSPGQSLVPDTMNDTVAPPRAA